jgi:DNA repair protein RadC
MTGGGSIKTGTEEAPAAEPASQAAKHYHGHRERIRQRIMKGDGSHFDDYEILEVLLCAFIPRVDVRPIAQELVRKFGTVSGALAAAPERLMEVDGIGETTAAYIRATNLLLQRAAVDAVKDRPVISNWAALLNYVSLKIRHEKVEQVRVLYLDRKNKLIADEKAGQGTVDHAPVYPREVARRALELSASSIILVHNHPSGDPSPSMADVELTRDIEKALASLEIRVHDHLVVGATDVVSMKAKGLI